jgi:chemotaxis protein methyltransferase CheR
VPGKKKVKMTDHEYTLLTEKVLRLTGIDLNAYKMTQMRRRLDSFVTHNSTGTVADFCSALEKQKSLLDNLRNYITINVSEFFRDKNSYDYLQRVIIPQLLKNRMRLNVWSAGCSYGQEPYSLGMLLADYPGEPSYRILATDIDPEALDRAKAGGPYSQEMIKNIPNYMVSKHIRFQNGSYFVNPSIKNKIEFRAFNLLNAGFEENFDLIVCRNVTIYFTESVKSELNRKFFKALRPGGVLFIGGTEVILDGSQIGFTSLTPSFYLKAIQSCVRSEPVKAIVAR